MLLISFQISCGSGGDFGLLNFFFMREANKTAAKKYVSGSYFLTHKNKFYSL
jgi:hypothetical protein